MRHLHVGNAYKAARLIIRKMTENHKIDLSSDSVKHLLHHWIEHNNSHSVSFRERAVQIEKISEKAAEDIRQAAELMDKCTEMLKKAMQDI
jgi:hypothetical protein